jgi:hypothetical protein
MITTTFVTDLNSCPLPYAQEGAEGREASWCPETSQCRGQAGLEVLIQEDQKNMSNLEIFF